MKKTLKIGYVEIFREPSLIHDGEVVGFRLDVPADSPFAQDYIVHDLRKTTTTNAIVNTLLARILMLACQIADAGKSWELFPKPEYPTKVFDERTNLRMDTIDAMLGRPGIAWDKGEKEFYFSRKGGLIEFGIGEKLVYKIFLREVHDGELHKMIE